MCFLTMTFYVLQLKTMVGRKMKKLILIIIFLIFILGCSSTQDIDSVSKASPPWKLDGAQKDFMKDKKVKYKTLVAYFSKTGNTQKIAFKISIMLKADLERIVDLNNRGFILGGGAATFGIAADINKSKYKAEDYDLVVIGTPIWSWSMSPAIRAYLNQNKGKFKKVAFFVTSGNTAPDNVVESMEKLIDTKSIAHIGYIEKDFKDTHKVQERLNTFLVNFLEMKK